MDDLIWLIFDAAMLTSGFNLDEVTQFAGSIHRAGFMTLLLRLFADKAAAEVETSEVSVRMDAFVRHIEWSESLDMPAARAFVRSELFLNNFNRVGHQIFRAV